MTTEEKKTWLGRYRLAGQEVRRLTEEIARWEAQAAALTPRYSGNPGGGKAESAIQRAVEEMLALREELAAELRGQVAIRREIEEAVGRVEDERLRELLRLRYLEGWRLEKIAAAWRYDYRWIRRLHRKALEAVSLCFLG